MNLFLKDLKNIIFKNQLNYKIELIDYLDETNLNKQLT